MSSLLQKELYKKFPQPWIIWRDFCRCRDELCVLLVIENDTTHQQIHTCKINKTSYNIVWKTRETLTETPLLLARELEKEIVAKDKSFIRYDDWYDKIDLYLGCGSRPLPDGFPTNVILYLKIADRKKENEKGFIFHPKSRLVFQIILK